VPTTYIVHFMMINSTVVTLNAPADFTNHIIWFHWYGTACKLTGREDFLN